MSARGRLRRAGALSLLMLGLAGLTGCPNRIARPADGPTEPAPVLARLAERSHALTSLSGMISLEVWRGDERVKLRQLLLVQRPDHIRVDTLSPFDQPLAMMASDGQSVTIYSLEQRRYEQGPATPDHLARLLRLPLTGDELTAVLAGGVPVRPDAQATLDWDDTAGAYILDLRTPERRQRLLVEPVAFRISEIRTYQGDTLVFVARFGDYDGEGPTAVPQRMRFEVPAEKMRVDAQFDDHTVNVTPPADAFVIPVPRGIPVEPL